MARVDKRKKANRSARIGPYVSATLIAEKILLEPDGASTIVRIVDRVGVDPVVVNQPMGTVIGLNLIILAAFRAGGFKGKSKVMIVHETPSGKTEAIGMSELQFDGTAAQTVNAQGPVVLKWEGAGQYWYNILLENKFVSRLPLLVTVGTSLPIAKKSKK
jgi:hypothetical protein